MLEPWWSFSFDRNCRRAASADYTELSAELSERVRQFPGFVAVKSFKADDGERLTVVWWRDTASLREWSTDAQHRLAKKTGRERSYEYYNLEVAEVIRTSDFQR